MCIGGSALGSVGFPIRVLGAVARKSAWQLFNGLDEIPDSMRASALGGSVLARGARPQITTCAGVHWFTLDLCIFYLYLKNYCLRALGTPKRKRLWWRTNRCVAMNTSDGAWWGKVGRGCTQVGTSS